MGFLFSVNVFVFIPMMLFFIIKNCGKLSKMGIYKIGWFFSMKLKKLAQRAAKDSTPTPTHILLFYQTGIINYICGSIFLFLKIAVMLQYCRSKSAPER